MRDGWFYSEDGKPIGPVSVEAMIDVLCQRPDPLNSVVWNTGYQICGPAKDVPEVAELLFRREEFAEAMKQSLK